VRSGHVYIVDGQKVWTSDGMQATHCQLLVRSQPDAPRHRGITCLLVPLDLAGITRRPLLTLSGDAEFSELFFDAVEVPASAVLGEPGGGWRVATATLAHERIGVATRAASLRREVDAALRALGPSASWATRAELVRRWSEARVLELLTQRVVAGGGGPAASALAKLSWGRLEQAATNAIADSSGLGAVGGEAESAAYRFLLARQATIGAGTSEVLRNVIAEQALGLPREVLARDVESSNDKTNQALGGARGRP
jgi:alkylation response protein AidB-like acyl-CoA dehydrogenase